MKPKNLNWWAIEKSPEYRRYVKAAKTAGKKNIPDPSRSSEPAPCFASSVGWAEDQAAHMAGEFLDDIRDDLLFVHRHGHVLASTQEVEVGPRDDRVLEAERRLRASDAQLADEVRARIASIRLRHGELLADLGSLDGAWKRVHGDMLDAFRANYMHGDYIDRINFPTLNLKSINYIGNGGSDVDHLLDLSGSGEHEPPMAIGVIAS